MNIFRRAIIRVLLGPTPIGANSDPPGTWVDYLAGRTSSAPVSEVKALNLSAVWCAVTLISNAMKCLPLKTYERLEVGKRPAVEHSNYKLLHRRPSPNFSPSRFQRLLTFWVVLWGNGRAEIERDRNGRIVALHPIHPSRCKTETRANGSVWHVVKNGNGTWTELPDRNVFHVQGLSEDGVSGLSIIGYARQSLGLAVSAEEYGVRFFDNNARPSVMLEHPGKLGEEAAKHLRKSWAEAFGGKGQHGTALLEEGMKANILGMPNEDAQFLETRQFQTIEVARWFNVQPHKLKDLERATFDNIAEQALDFVGDTVLPYAIDWEQEANRKFFNEDEQDQFFAEFLMDALLRADPKSRNEAFEIKRRCGVLNANEWRAMENENPIDGPEGDMYIVEANMTNAKLLASGGVPERRREDRRQDGADDPNTVTDDDGVVGSQVVDVAQAHAPVVAVVLEQMFRVEMNAATRAEKKTGDLGEWSVDYFEGHKSILRSALIPYMESLGDAVRVVLAGDPTDDQWDTFVGNFTGSITNAHIAWATDVLNHLPYDSVSVRTMCSKRARGVVGSFAQNAVSTYGEKT